MNCSEKRCAVGSAEGVRKVAAKRLGLTLAEYDARIAAGLKWCGKCREWQPTGDFGIDRTRGDGLASHCSASTVRSTDGPGTRERRIRAGLGLGWCRGCEEWLPLAEVSAGACREHIAAEERARYARDTERIRDRKVAANRARAQLEPIPGWWQEQQMREFGGLCAYGCGRSAIGLDHIQPISLGGKSEPSNLVPACKPCNSGKRDREPGPWIMRFAAAFPDQFEALFALSFEHASSLDLSELDLSEVA